MQPLLVALRKNESNVIDVTGLLAGAVRKLVGTVGPESPRKQIQATWPPTGQERCQRRRG